TAAASADDADAIAGEQAGPGPVGDATVDAARPGEERGGVAVAAVDGAAAADDHAAVDDDAAVHDDAAAGRQAQLHDPEVDEDHGRREPGRLEALRQRPDGRRDRQEPRRPELRGPD